MWSTITRGFRKIIVAGQADRTKPDPETWSLVTPPANIWMPLQVYFHESMDYLLASEGITLAMPEPIEGKGSLENHQQTRSFTPTSKWKKGRYHVRIESRFENLSGNNLNRLFDENIRQNSRVNAEQDLFYLPFEIR